MSSHRRPPVWLAAAATASGWAAAYSVGLWVLLFVRGPIHEDVRMTYVAAQAGLHYGWPAIYDEATLRSLSAAFPPGARLIDPVYTYINPPLLAWLFSPLTAFPEPVAYALWTVLSLVALVLAWRIAAPYRGLARIALLLLAVGLWPVLLAFYFGQPTMLLLLLMAGAWWLATHDRPLAAGAALAIATFLKPQDVILVPVLLLVSGRYRPAAGWLIGCIVLGVATIVTLQPSGVASWWQALERGQASSAHLEYTLGHFFGLGPLTYALWTLQCAAAIAVAWWRRAQPEMVFVAGILGTTAVAFHFHELDYSILVLAAWFFLRTSPPLWQRMWLLVGIVTMQVMTFGPQATQPFWDVATHAPQLIWDAAWLAILFVSSFPANRLAAVESPVVTAGARSRT